MKLSKTVVTRYVLELDSNEARLLRGLVQNPIMNNEPKEVAELRQKIFDGLMDKLDRPLDAF